MPEHHSALVPLGSGRVQAGSLGWLASDRPAGSDEQVRLGLMGSFDAVDSFMEKTALKNSDLQLQDHI